ncbi:transmembrane-type terpene cyclase [Arundinibacter roseus]|uniref:Uncharacterized protein n=1 Tax=Arundinibacter roseus TaxID=2070510 RepID=A0A4R4KLC9_9BACT|nr:hypothetical protein [Arundinibacter roseus]TDB67391.1 hypothetical protein EZE20_05430 [Arundinibacter roseus]
MKYIIALLVPIGGLLWTSAYLLIVLKGIKDKAHGMPLVALALNFTWEFVHVFIYPSYGISLYLNLSWFLIDLGITYTYFRYSYKSFEMYYSINKVHWLLLSITTLVLAFMLNYYAEGYFSQLQNITTKELLFAEVLVGFIVFLFVPGCMIAMLFQRKSSQGQSFFIGLALSISIIIYVLEISFNPFHHQWGNPFMMVLMAVCIILQMYYTVLIYHQMKQEGKNPWKTF